MIYIIEYCLHWWWCMAQRSSGRQFVVIPNEWQKFGWLIWLLLQRSIMIIVLTSDTWNSLSPPSPPLPHPLSLYHAYAIESFFNVLITTNLDNNLGTRRSGWMCSRLKHGVHCSHHWAAIWIQTAGKLNSLHCGGWQLIWLFDCRSWLWKKDGCSD